MDPKFIPLYYLSSLAGLISASLTGRIYEAGTKTGIGDLTVRLIPPGDVKKPEKVTTTDEDGNFRFTDLSGDKYLLEVYQGLTLLYREVIEKSGIRRKKSR